MPTWPVVWVRIVWNLIWLPGSEATFFEDLLLLLSREALMNWVHFLIIISDSRAQGPFRPWSRNPPAWCGPCKPHVLSESSVFPVLSRYALQPVVWVPKSCHWAYKMLLTIPSKVFKKDWVISLSNLHALDPHLVAQSIVHEDFNHIFKLLRFFQSPIKRRIYWTIASSVVLNPSEFINTAFPGLWNTSKGSMIVNGTSKGKPSGTLTFCFFENRARGTSITMF